MNFKKIIAVAVTLFLFLCPVTVGTSTGPDVDKLIEIRYRSAIDSHNSLWNCLFLLYPENREFLWHEKYGENEYGRYQEIILSDKNGKIVAVFFTQDKLEPFARVDFGGGDWCGDLSRKQIKTWLEMQNFSRTAKPGDVYRANYKTSKNDYKIFIEAREFSILELGGKPVKTLYFEGNILKKDKKFTDIKFWIIREGELKGQMAKCAFKRSFWPLVVIEIM